MVRFVHKVARYRKIHIRYNVLIPGKIVMPGNPLVPEVLDICVCVCVGRKMYVEMYRYTEIQDYYEAIEKKGGYVKS
jgi:hypothetical protein